MEKQTYLKLNLTESIDLILPAYNDEKSIICNSRIKFVEYSKENYEKFKEAFMFD